MPLATKLRRSKAAARVLDYARPRVPYCLLANPTPIDVALAGLGRGRTFVQVGANDGVTADPVYRFTRWAGWSGITIEPSPKPFARLTSTYRNNPKVRTVQAAVADEAGTADFFFVDPRPGDPFFTDMIGSFSREHLLRHGIPDGEHRVQRMTVPVRTVSDICAEHGLTHVDLVALDVEGYDSDLLRILPYADLSIGAVLFEHCHMQPDELLGIEDLLSEAGLSRVAASHVDALWRRA